MGMIANASNNMTKFGLGTDDSNNDDKDKRTNSDSQPSEKQ